jgi:hypothetical protein
MNNDELTPSEKNAMEALPRERFPSAALEERVVKALRDRGVLYSGKGRIITVTYSKMAYAIAASIVLLVAVFALGRWSGSRQIEHMDITELTASEISVAASLQRAGTAYILALENFASLPDSASSEEIHQGCEVALSTFYTAAAQMTKLVPKSYLAGQLLQAIEIGVVPQTEGEAGKSGPRSIWF